MKRLIFLMLVVAMGLGGCGKSRHDADAESVDGNVQADTANIDPAANTDALPTVDQSDGTTTAPADNANVTSDAAQVGATTEATPAVTTPPESPAVSQNTPPPAEPSSVGSGQIASYTVQKGDTLMKVAFNLYGDISQWRTLYELNKTSLKNPDSLIAGMTLKYDKPASEPVVEKNGDPYLIKTGDTLGTIAQDIYAKRSKWKKIYENNRTLIKDPNKIYAGFYIYYQITEAERKEAEELKAKGGQQLGKAPAEPDSAAVGKPAAPVGGLDQLSAPAGRAPASVGK